MSWTPFLPEANHQAGPKTQRLSVQTVFDAESSMPSLSCVPGPWTDEQTNGQLQTVTERQGEAVVCALPRTRPERLFPSAFVSLQAVWLTGRASGSCCVGGGRRTWPQAHRKASRLSGWPMPPRRPWQTLGRPAAHVTSTSTRRWGGGRRAGSQPAQAASKAGRRRAMPRERAARWSSGSTASRLDPDVAGTGERGRVQTGSKKAHDPARGTRPPPEHPPSVWCAAAGLLSLWALGGWGCVRLELHSLPAPPQSVGTRHPVSCPRIQLSAHAAQRRERGSHLPPRGQEWVTNRNTGSTSTTVASCTNIILKQEPGRSAGNDLLLPLRGRVTLSPGGRWGREQPRPRRTFAGNTKPAPWSQSGPSAPAGPQ